MSSPQLLWLADVVRRVNSWPLLAIASAWLAGCGATAVPFEPRAPRDFIYVLSVAAFQDSDADGLGDLQGVRWHLEHIRSLGVQSVQLTPIEPGWDLGRTAPAGPGVDPALGSVADLGELADDVHALGMSLEVQVPMDVIGRSHPWFRQALRGGGRLLIGPNPGEGWCSTTGVQFYFAPTGCGRPELDWDDAGLPADLAGQVAEFATVGVDGLVVRAFRSEGERTTLDAAEAMVLELRRDAPELVTPAAADEQGVESLLPWAALGPVADLPRELAWEAAARDRDVGWVQDVLEDWGDSVGTTRPFLGDYEHSRLGSRVSDPELRRTLMVLHLLGPGHPSIYYGEELDLFDATTLPVDSPWRAPMPWTDAAHCGFSTVDPWFEADPACKVGWNAYDEARDPSSMLTLVRWLGEMRATWGAATATSVPTGFDDVLAFQTGHLFVVGSVSAVDREVSTPGGEDLTDGSAVGVSVNVPAGTWRVVRVGS